MTILNRVNIAIITCDTVLGCQKLRKTDQNSFRQSLLWASFVAPFVIWSTTKVMDCPIVNKSNQYCPWKMVWFIPEK